MKKSFVIPILLIIGNTLLYSVNSEHCEFEGSGFRCTSRTYLDPPLDNISIYKIEWRLATGLLYKSYIGIVDNVSGDVIFSTIRHFSYKQASHETIGLRRKVLNIKDRKIEIAEDVMNIYIMVFDSTGKLLSRHTAIGGQHIFLSERIQGCLFLKAVSNEEVFNTQIKLGE